MFQWYKDSAECLVYLSDVSALDEQWEAQFRRSRWFRRGWTLQELIAPEVVIFYDRDWTPLGTRQDLRAIISEITHIPEEVLVRGPVALDKLCVAQRMSWASMRMTSEPEDMSYCLLGLFDVNLPLMYGEGARKAFLRLQEAIIKQTDDNSIFAWRISEEEAKTLQFSGFLARSPRDFSSSMTIYTTPFGFSADSLRVTISPGGLDLNLHLEPRNSHGLYSALLDCFSETEDHTKSRVSILVQKISTSRFFRVHIDKLPSVEFWARSGRMQQLFVKHNFAWPKSPLAIGLITQLSSTTSDGLELCAVSFYPEDKFYRSATGFPMYMLAEKTNPPVSATELMADLSTIRRLVYGVVTFAVQAKPLEKLPSLPSGELETSPAKSFVSENEDPVNIHKFDIVFGFESLASKEGTKRQRLFPWVTVAKHNPPPPKTSESNEMTLSEWRRKFDNIAEGRHSWEYSIPLSAYDGLEEYSIPLSASGLEVYASQQRLWVIDNLHLTMRQEMVCGVLMYVIRIRSESSPLSWKRGLSLEECEPRA